MRTRSWNLPGNLQRKVQGTLAAVMLSAGAFWVAWGMSGCTGGASAGDAGTSGGTTAVSYAIYPAAGNPLIGDPLTSAGWRGAQWHELTGALNDPRSGPATRAAMMYDADDLYVAFVSEDRTPGTQDAVEVWLDSTADHNGRELFCVSVGPGGKADTAWYRNSVTPAPLADGSPDTSMTVTRISNVAVKGMQTVAGQGEWEGKPVWTMVVKVPLHALPGPLKTVGREGAHWRVNLMRYDVEDRADGSQVVVQSNLAPIYQARQSVSPYRMADVVLQSGPGVAAGQ